MKWTMTEEYDGMMLRDFLFDVLNFSNRLVKRAKSTSGELLVNGERKTVRYRLQHGDILEIILPKEEKSESITSENIPLEIVYEDDYLFIINKRAGMPTIPSRLHPTGTVANAVLYYYEKNAIPYTVHIVTRLDKDTSGLVLIAKNQYSHSLFSTLQRKNTLSRKYIAIVHGKLARKKATICAPIGRKSDSIIERIVTSEGKKAITHYEVIDEINDYSLVKTELETGRTHQIRVHFSSIGHPLVGDDLYGGKREPINRQALHCAEISFIHPFLQEAMTVKAELPLDMIEMIIGKN